MKKNVLDFLDRHSLNADNIDMDWLVSRFIDEMRAGLAGKDSSLAMIPSFCSPEASPKAGEKVIVIDAGGTNLRTCTVTFDSNLNPVIGDFQKTSMPGIDRQVTAKEFFATFADQVERLIDMSDRIGFCFSYAAEILPDHDGVPLFFSKEIKAPEVLGKHIGKELLGELGRRGHDVSQKKIIILNDTVTTLLAAQARNHNGSFDGCVGFILGTGTNTAYIERNSNIAKIGGEGSQIINVESGNMDLCLGDIDRAFLDSTVEPGKYCFEKMISGAYLGPLAHKVIEFGVKEGLFSEDFSSKFAELPTLLTREMNDFMLDNPCKLAEIASDEDDYDTLTDILGSFITRAAKLTAANLASAIMITDYGKDEDHPVLINADGTTFHVTAFLKNCTTEYLEAYLAEKGRRAVITQIENSPTIGSAIGALTL